MVVKYAQKHRRPCKHPLKVLVFEHCLLTLKELVLGIKIHRHEELNTNKHSFSVSLFLTLAYHSLSCSAINS